MSVSKIFQGTPEGAMMSLQQRIRSRAVEVGIMGLGYVGLPEAMEFAKAGLRVTGFDIDSTRIQNSEAGCSYLVDISEQELGRVSWSPFWWRC